MREREFLITLISKSQARIGNVFINKGPCPECKDCRYFQVCIRNLEVGRVYKILRIREKTLLCDFLNTEMVVVEIEQAGINAAIPSKIAVEGAVVAINKIRCDIEDCKNIQLCFPIGIKNIDRCQVLSVSKNLSCPLNLSLKSALLRPLDS